jgi:hypothetical protein
MSNGNETPKNPTISAVAVTTSTVSATGKEAVSTSAPVPDQIMELLAKVSKLEAKVDLKEDAKKASSGALNNADARAIDWSKVTEKDIFEMDFPLEVIEQEVPEYMNVYLKDNNMVARWCHKSERHLGTRIAQGYDFVKESDWDENKPQILKFNSEGHLTCEDVVAMKISKMRYYSSLKRVQLKSTQLKNVNNFNKVKGALNQSMSNIRGMENAVNRGAMTFYDESVESRIEQITI